MLFTPFIGIINILYLIRIFVGRNSMGRLKQQKENKEITRKVRQQYYIKNRLQLQEKVKEYARIHPSMNKDAVAKWRKSNPQKDPSKYRVGGKLRKKCISVWGDICPICNRSFAEKGYLKRIVHHLQYEPIEQVVIICYQCHSLIHSKKCYGHPFVILGGEESPECMALSILDLQNRYIEVYRLKPRKLGGSRKKESEITLISK